MTDAIRLCRDCRWMGRPGNVAIVLRIQQCQHPSSRVAERLDLVSGLTIEGYQMYCGTARGSRSRELCGPEGRYWETKE